MGYIELKTPTPRSYDTPIGKVMGYLANILEWLRWENYAAQIDAIFPDWWPMGSVQGFLIDICKACYNALYQKAYDNGADKGNEINSQIMGWVDDAKRRAESLVNDAKAYVENNLIAPIRNQINNQITPALNDARAQISKFKSDIDNMANRINQFQTSLNSMDGTIKNFDMKLQSFNAKLSDLTRQADNLNAQISQINKTISDFKTQIKNLDERVKRLEQKAGQPAFPIPKLGW
jgi:prefoldin subunit 5